MVPSPYCATRCASPRWPVEPSRGCMCLVPPEPGRWSSHLDCATAWLSSSPVPGAYPHSHTWLGACGTSHGAMVVASCARDLHEIRWDCGALVPEEPPPLGGPPDSTLAVDSCLGC